MEAVELTPAQARNLALEAARAERLWIGVGLAAVVAGLVVTTLLGADVRTQTTAGMLPGVAVILLAMKRRSISESFVRLADDPAATWTLTGCDLEARSKAGTYLLELPRRVSAKHRGLPEARVVRDHE